MRKSSIRCAVTLAALFGAGGIAHSAEIDLIPGQAPNQIVIQIDGLIAAGDAQRFVSLAMGATSATVVLQGAGGLLEEALLTGGEIQRRNFYTLVESHASCFSACALIWIAGRARFISAGARIGFHETYIEFDGLPRRKGLDNAQVSSFLIQLGISAEAVAFIMNAPHGNVTYLTPTLARALGIEVFERVGDAVITPEAAPTFERLVRLAAVYANLNDACSAVLAFDKSALRAGAAVVDERARRVVDERDFVDISTRWTNARMLEMTLSGLVRPCLEDIELLRVADHTVFPAGPSFECSEPRAEGQVAICSDAQLSALDRILAELYESDSSVLTGDQLEQRESDHRVWIELRNACLAEVACLTLAYQTRIDELTP